MLSLINCYEVDTDDSGGTIVVRGDRQWFVKNKQLIFVHRTLVFIIKKKIVFIEVGMVQSGNYKSLDMNYIIRGCGVTKTYLWLVLMRSFLDNHSPIVQSFLTGRPTSIWF